MIQKNYLYSQSLVLKQAILSNVRRDPIPAITFDNILAHMNQLTNDQYRHWHLIVAALFFGSAVVALFFSGQRPLAIAFALLVLLNHILIYVWAQ